MGITGIIAEYNPFHLGHAYQLRKIRETSAKTVVVMSGDAVQRGEFSVTDKWNRTELALRNGADLVIELPPVYSLSSANLFAEGAVRILSSLSFVDDICFGAEDSTSTLSRLADILDGSDTALEEKIRHYLSLGMSYPKAQHDAVLSLYGDVFSEAMSRPNNILGIEYIKAVRKYGNRLGIRAIPRTSVHDGGPDNGYASGLAIRKMMRKGDPSWKDYVPSDDLSLYEGQVFTEDCFMLLISRLREPDALDKLSRTPDTSEGIENRIVAAAREAEDYESLLSGIKSKRYPLSRIRRILMNFLLGITRDDVSLMEKSKPLVRVLGIRKDSMELLSLLSSDNDIELVTGLPRDDISRPLQIALTASNIRGLLCDPPKRFNSDYYHRFLTI